MTKLFEEVPDTQPDSVFLMARGYEWACPSCGGENEEVETSKRVICQTCKITHEVAGCDHAGGDV